MGALTGAVGKCDASEVNYQVERSLSNEIELIEDRVEGSGEGMWEEDLIGMDNIQRNWC